MHKRPLSRARLRHVPSQFSWGDQRLVRDRSIDQRSPQACALSLFLVTVAAAQGLRSDADPSLCQRWSLASGDLHQARQALITRGVIAYQRPLSQGLALDAAPREAPPSASPGAADDDPVDIKAVFARLWEVVS
jgi:hypothetical protein